MSLALTPHLAAAVYDCLREFPPFKRMKLPPADEVEFRIVADKTLHGWHNSTRKKGQHIIAISAGGVGQFATLVRITGHEMIHLYQYISKTTTANTEHNAQFNRVSKRACKLFDWDYAAFL